MPQLPYNHVQHAASVCIGDTFRLRLTDKVKPMVVGTSLSDDGTTVTLMFDDHSHYTFRTFDDPVMFPRRPDGSTIDWRRSDTPPTVHDLAYGDMLPDYFTGLATDKWWMRVMSVTPPARSPHNLAVVTCQLPSDEFARFVFAQTEPVVFPRELYDDTPMTRGRVHKTGNPEWFGPYRHRMTGARFMFTEHPFGRGRWPASIKPFDPQAEPLPNDECHRMRYPKSDWDWNLEPLEPNLPTGSARRVRRGGFSLI